MRTPDALLARGSLVAFSLFFASLLVVPAVAVLFVAASLVLPPAASIAGEGIGIPAVVRSGRMSMSWAAWRRPVRAVDVCGKRFSTGSAGISKSSISPTRRFPSSWREKC